MFNGIFKYWEYLPSVVRRHFVYKVAVIGPESTGKTTLVKYLAKRFSTSYVSEYGKEYVINELGGNESILQYDDYTKIAYNHKINEYKEERTANKILFLDSEATTTQYYCMLYNNCTNDIVEQIIKEQNYDLYLYCNTDVEWIEDGLRMNNDREMTDNLFRSLLEEHIKDKSKIVEIKGSYEERLDYAIKIIKEKIKGV